MDERERQSIDALRRGDIQGLESLFQRYQLQAIRTALLITNDRQLAEDIVMDSFLIVYDRIRQFDVRRPFLPWFYRIVVNNALMALRQKRRRTMRKEQEELLPRLPSGLHTPEEVCILAELDDTLIQAFRTLPPKQRTAAVLRFYLDMDEAAMARVLGCPLGTVKWRLHAARQRLRGILEKEGGIPTASV